MDGCEKVRGAVGYGQRKQEEEEEAGAPTSETLTSSSPFSGREGRATEGQKPGAPF